MTQQTESTEPADINAIESPDCYPIFDGHNDALLSLTLPERGKNRSFLVESEHGHLDLPRAYRGGLAGGFFAIFIPNPEMVEDDDEKTADEDKKDFDWMQARRDGTLTLPEPIDFEYASTAATEMANLLFEIERTAKGRFAVVRTVREIESNIEQRVVSAILHFEGAEPIRSDLSNLETWYDRGLRSIGLVWSRGNAFAEGVPFRCPGSPDTGPGLTDAGKALVRACNELGILIDLSHLNEQGFRDVAALSNRPLVATHSCAHAICPSTRNLTDEQLDLICASDGLVGCNFFVADVRADGRMEKDTSLDHLVRQVDYLVDRLGIDRVAFGSDFDGATMPDDLDDASKLPNLVAALRDAGYDDEALSKLRWRNWRRILRATWNS